MYIYIYIGDSNWTRRGCRGRIIGSSLEIGVLISLLERSNSPFLLRGDLTIIPLKNVFARVRSLKLWISWKGKEGKGKKRSESEKFLPFHFSFSSLSRTIFPKRLFYITRLRNYRFRPLFTSRIERIRLETCCCCLLSVCGEFLAG